MADAHVCTPAVRLQVLGQVPLFASLDPTELAYVDARCRAHDFSAGAAIYHSGDSARWLHVVATGTAKVTRLNADGRETLLDVLGPGDFLGALPALGLEQYTDSASAMTPMCLLGIDAAEFDVVMKTFPSVVIAVLQGVSRRLTESQEAVHLLSGASLEQRLAATLLVLAAKVGEPWHGTTLLQLPLARDDLAAMTGAAAESVSRLLSTWHRTGLIETGRRWIAIRDGAALAALRDG